ncbi:MAG: cytochrome c oxidase assembly protein, partial [Mycolicibacterium aromaticivorans]|nr:cytochrome c oxidase assembly protein [Mycolicibacterium aromaticivorans]
DYYAALQRDWGPSLRTDQSIGAGILWILGDVLSIPFVVALMRQLGTDERRKAKLADAALDEATADGASALWWENDPALRDRFSR